MMESIVRQTIVEHLDVSSSNLALDPTVELSRLINELMLVEPLLYKYRKNKNPKTNKEWSRLEKANSIAFILYDKYKNITNIQHISFEVYLVVVSIVCWYNRCFPKSNRSCK